MRRQANGIQKVLPHGIRRQRRWSATTHIAKWLRNCCKASHRRHGSISLARCKAMQRSTKRRLRPDSLEATPRARQVRVNLRLQQLPVKHYRKTLSKDYETTFHTPAVTGTSEEREGSDEGKTRKQVKGRKIAFYSEI